MLMYCCGWLFAVLQQCYLDGSPNRNPYDQQLTLYANGQLLPTSRRNTIAKFIIIYLQGKLIRIEEFNVLLNIYRLTRVAKYTCISVLNPPDMQIFRFKS